MSFEIELQLKMCLFLFVDMGYNYDCNNKVELRLNSLKVSSGHRQKLLKKKMYLSNVTSPCKLFKSVSSLFKKKSAQEWDTGQTDAEDVKYTLVTKHLSWRRSFTSTAT